MKASKRSGLGFTLIELLVTIAIIAILASLLFGVVARGKRSALSAKCKSNLRQVHLAMSMYDADHGIYPRGWLDQAMDPTRDMRFALSKFWWGKLMDYAGIPIPEGPVTSRSL